MRLRLWPRWLGKRLYGRASHEGRAYLMGTFNRLPLARLAVLEVDLEASPAFETGQHRPHLALDLEDHDLLAALLVLITTVRKCFRALLSRKTGEMTIAMMYRRPACWPYSRRLMRS